jgi:hypothetical protein
VTAWRCGVDPVGSAIVWCREAGTSDGVLQHLSAEEKMEHKTFDDIRRVADVVSVDVPGMTRRERLERWAQLLLREPRRPLEPLPRMEFLYARDRAALRSDRSPIAVAFRDPILRHEGLQGDRVGDAMAFFDLTTSDAHLLLCDCHYQGAMNATWVAAQIRSIANRVTLREIWNRVAATARSLWA